MGETASAGERRMRRLDAALIRDADLLAGATRSQQSELRAAREALALDEITASTALAGYRLTRAELGALLGRGVAAGGKRLETYDAVADYAEAVRFADGLEPAGGRRSHPYIRTGELLELHRRVCRRTGVAPGSWRERNVAAVRSGLVPPAHWLVPREVASFADRFAAGPGPRAQPIAWVAGAHARLLRIQPFDGGSGRVRASSRTCCCGDSAGRRRRSAGSPARYYRPALAAADGGDVAALAELTGDAVASSFTRLVAALGRSGTCARCANSPLPTDLAALVKAAQRGRPACCGAVRACFRRPPGSPSIALTSGYSPGGMRSMSCTAMYPYSRNSERFVSRYARNRDSSTVAGPLVTMYS